MCIRDSPHRELGCFCGGAALAIELLSELLLPLPLLLKVPRIPTLPTTRDGASVRAPHPLSFKFRPECLDRCSVSIVEILTLGANGTPLERLLESLSAAHSPQAADGCAACSRLEPDRRSENALPLGAALRLGAERWSGPRLMVRRGEPRAVARTSATPRTPRAPSATQHSDCGER